MTSRPILATNRQSRACQRGPGRRPGSIGSFRILISALPSYRPLGELGPLLHLSSPLILKIGVIKNSAS